MAEIRDLSPRRYTTAKAENEISYEEQIDGLKDSLFLVLQVICVTLVMPVYEGLVVFFGIPADRRSAGPAKNDSHSTSRAGHSSIPPFIAGTIFTKIGVRPETGGSDGLIIGIAM